MPNFALNGCLSQRALVSRNHNTGVPCLSSRPCAYTCSAACSSRSIRRHLYNYQLLRQLQPIVRAVPSSALESETASPSSGRQQQQQQLHQHRDGQYSSIAATQPHFKIIFQDEHLIAIEKPSGVFVHPPEDGYPIPPEENAMRLLKTQLGGTYLYPVHRLDRPTSGVLVYCLTQEAASGFGRASRERRINKSYMAMCRGYAQPTGVVDKELDGAESITQYETLATAEIPYAIGNFAKARYSLLKVTPLTGHYHQIRRHLNRIDRPIVGDTDHGDRAHNRLFSRTLSQPGLFLKCTQMAFDHPVHGPDHPLVLQSTEWEPRWHLAFDFFGLCPVPYY